MEMSTTSTQKQRTTDEELQKGVLDECIPAVKAKLSPSNIKGKIEEALTRSGEGSIT